MLRLPKITAPSLRENWKKFFGIAILFVLLPTLVYGALTVQNIVKQAAESQADQLVYSGSPVASSSPWQQVQSVVGSVVSQVVSQIQQALPQAAQSNLQEFSQEMSQGAPTPATSNSSSGDQALIDELTILLSEAWHWNEASAFDHWGCADGRWVAYTAWDRVTPAGDWLIEADQALRAVVRDGNCGGFYWGWELAAEVLLESMRGLPSISSGSLIGSGGEGPGNIGVLLEEFCQFGHVEAAGWCKDESGEDREPGTGTNFFGPSEWAGFRRSELTNINWAVYFSVGLTENPGAVFVSPFQTDTTHAHLGRDLLTFMDQMLGYKIPGCLGTGSWVSSWGWMAGGPRLVNELIATLRAYQGVYGGGGAFSALSGDGLNTEVFKHYNAYSVWFERTSQFYKRIGEFVDHHPEHNNLLDNLIGSPLNCDPRVTQQITGKLRITDLEYLDEEVKRVAVWVGGGPSEQWFDYSYRSQGYPLGNGVVNYSLVVDSGLYEKVRLEWLGEGGNHLGYVENVSFDSGSVQITAGSTVVRDIAYGLWDTGIQGKLRLVRNENSEDFEKVRVVFTSTDSNVSVRCVVATAGSEETNYFCPVSPNNYDSVRGVLLDEQNQFVGLGRYYNSATFGGIDLTGGGVHQLDLDFDLRRYELIGNIQLLINEYSDEFAWCVPTFTVDNSLFYGDPFRCSGGESAVNFYSVLVLPGGLKVAGVVLRDQFDNYVQMETKHFNEPIMVGGQLRDRVDLVFNLRKLNVSGEVTILRDGSSVEFDEFELLFERVGGDSWYSGKRIYSVGDDELNIHREYEFLMPLHPGVFKPFILLYRGGQFVAHIDHSDLFEVGESDSPDRRFDLTFDLREVTCDSQDGVCQLDLAGAAGRVINRVGNAIGVGAYIIPGFEFGEEAEPESIGQMSCPILHSCYVPTCSTPNACVSDDACGDMGGSSLSQFSCEADLVCCAQPCPGRCQNLLSGSCQTGETDTGEQRDCQYGYRCCIPEETPECSTGETRCSGTELQECGSAGTWGAVATCNFGCQTLEGEDSQCCGQEEETCCADDACGLNLSCSDGVCVADVQPCRDGERACFGAGWRSCTGEEWNPVNSCEVDCSGGQCCGEEDEICCAGDTCDSETPNLSCEDGTCVIETCTPSWQCLTPSTCYEEDTACGTPDRYKESCCPPKTCTDTPQNLCQDMIVECENWTGCDELPGRWYCDTEVPHCLDPSTGKGKCCPSPPPDVVPVPRYSVDLGGRNLTKGETEFRTGQLTVDPGDLLEFKFNFRNRSVGPEFGQSIWVDLPGYGEGFEYVSEGSSLDCALDSSSGMWRCVYAGGQFQNMYRYYSGSGSPMQKGQEEFRTFRLRVKDQAPVSVNAPIEVTADIRGFVDDVKVTYPSCHCPDGACIDLGNQEVMCGQERNSGNNWGRSWSGHNTWEANERFRFWSNTLNISIKIPTLPCITSLTSFPTLDDNGTFYVGDTVTFTCTGAGIDEPVTEIKFKVVKDGQTVREAANPPRPSGTQSACGEHYQSSFSYQIPGTGSFDVFCRVCTATGCAGYGG